MSTSWSVASLLASSSSRSVVLVANELCVCVCFVRLCVSVCDKRFLLCHVNMLPCYVPKKTQFVRNFPYFNLWFLVIRFVFHRRCDRFLFLKVFFNLVFRYIFPLFPSLLSFIFCFLFAFFLLSSFAIRFVVICFVSCHLVIGKSIQPSRTQVKSK